MLYPIHQSRIFGCSQPNMLSYKLNQNIDTNKLIENIQKLVHKKANDPEKEFLLVIDVKEIAYSDDSSIPKLEYKP